jgi:anaerobic selenocysteine-containing dehydrogenase
MIIQRLHSYCSMCGSRCGVLATVDVQHRYNRRLRRQVPHPCLQINPTTASALSIQDGE